MQNNSETPIFIYQGLADAMDAFRERIETNKFNPEMRGYQKVDGIIKTDTHGYEARYVITSPKAQLSIHDAFDEYNKNSSSLWWEDKD